MSAAEGDITTIKKDYMKIKDSEANILAV